MFFLRFYKKTVPTITVCAIINSSLIFVKGSGKIFMRERRKYLRFNIHQMIELSIGKENYVSAEAVNLSESGILCRTEQGVEPYSRMFLLIGVPTKEGEKKIRCEGVVIRCDAIKGGYYDVGVEFTSVDDREALKNFLYNK